MSVFEDKKLTQLDWMTQMTETIESDLNTILSKLPNVIFINGKHISESGSSYLSLSIGNILNPYISTEIYKRHNLSWDEERLLISCFSFDLKGHTEYDARTGILSGEIIVIKNKHTFSDEELQPLMGKRGMEAIGRATSYGHADAPIDRLNEILDILGGCEEAMRNRSGKKKVVAIKERLISIFKNNEWRIRDMNLSNKVGFWIKGYINDGNLADLTNLCKLKVMTHNNMPIYSVKEEV